MKNFLKLYFYAIYGSIGFFAIGLACANLYRICESRWIVGAFCMVFSIANLWITGFLDDHINSL